MRITRGGLLKASDAAGTSALVDRARYQSVGAAADNSLAEWNPTPVISHGRPLLDFTDPTAPTVLIAGLYAMSVWGQFPANPGKFGRLDFEMDGNGDDITFEQSAPLDGFGGQSATITTGGTWYMPVGASLYCAVNHDIGSAAGLFRLSVQLVAEG